MLSHDLQQSADAESVAMLLADGSVIPEELCDDAARLGRLAISVSRLGNDSVAIALLRRAIGLHPAEASYHSNLGNVLANIGDSDGAAQQYKEAIRLRPQFADAHFNLGNAMRNLRRPGEAVQAYRRAIALKHSWIEPRCNLGTLHIELGQVGEAIAAFEDVIEIDPLCAQGHYGLGIALKHGGALIKSLQPLKRATEINPNWAEAFHCIGNIQRELGHVDEAIGAYRKALVLKPDLHACHCSLGCALKDRGEVDEAIAAFERAVQLKPDDAVALMNLGTVLVQQGHHSEGIARYREAIACNAEYAEAHGNLGIALLKGGDLDEAIIALSTAVRLNPNLPEAHCAIGNALKDQGKSEQAIASYWKAIVLRPDALEIHSNLLLAMQYTPGFDAATIAQEHRNWGTRYAAPAASEKVGLSVTAEGAPHRSVDPDRRLRLGYISADLRDHPVGRFLLPLLQHHNHEDFEVVCYSNSSQRDAITTQLQSCADHWHEVGGVKDADLAHQIAQASIDILVDLAGHTGGNRLLVLARQPAPVQVSYLGYPGTTGVDAIGYRLSDGYADPAGVTDHLCTERLHRLPDTNWCFSPAEEAPDVSSSPAERRGYITFGSLNNFAKTNRQVLESWATILNRVPDSRLLLKSGLFRSTKCSDDVHRTLASMGIDAGRVTLLPLCQDLRDHLAAYNEMDIALDTFPYNGTHTTCEALWMGVPVISLAGNSHVSRVGASILNNVGLAKLIVSNPDEYVTKAISLATNRSHLKTMRGELRQRVKESMLMDAVAFTRNVEQAYRSMWRSWCQTALKDRGKPRAEA